MIPAFSAEITVPILFLIGISYAVIPYLTPPYIQFGVRIYNEPGSLPLRKYRMGFAVVSILLSAALILAILIESSLSEPISISLAPLIQLAGLFIVYLAFHYHVLAIRGEPSITGTREIASAFIQTGEGSFRYLFLLVPWIFMFLYILAGILYYNNIPETFPTHFGLNGVPNEYATKSLLSVFSVLLFVGIPITALMEIMAIAILHSRPFQNPSSPVKTAIQNSAFNRINSSLILSISLPIQLTLFLASATTWGLIPQGDVSLAVLPTLIIIPLVLIVALRTGQTGWKLYPGATEKKELATARNDDTKWKTGVFYMNKDDKSLLVPKRFGYGYTMNFGHLVTWLVLVLPIIVLLIVILFTLHDI
ncbi:MAG: DUF1648 domain-containing protein [Thermoplasmata archaeon]